jgi:Fur family peroxide stress response transcriptional regulator
MERDMRAACESKTREFEAVCKKHGLALTIQRRAIIESLASRLDHPTADQVYEEVADKIKGVSRTTVYRVLETFVSIGLAKKISNPESKARFDADTTRHHHLTCMNCGLVLDLVDSALNNVQVPAEFLENFEVMDYSITFTGICAACKRQDMKFVR